MFDQEFFGGFFRRFRAGERFFFEVFRELAFGQEFREFDRDAVQRCEVRSPGRMVSPAAGIRS